MKRFLVVALVLFAVPLLAVGTKNPRILKAKKKIPNAYIVVFEDRVTDVEAVASELLSRGQAKHLYKSALKGFAADMSDAAAATIAQDPRVKYVEEDSEVSLEATQSGATWGLDRIDQRNRPLDGSYTYNTSASNVHAYIIDTGIHTSHNDFAGRASSRQGRVARGRPRPELQRVGNELRSHRRRELGRPELHPPRRRQHVPRRRRFAGAR